jgi:hypothetical protein
MTIVGDRMQPPLRLVNNHSLRILMKLSLIVRDQAGRQADITAPCASVMAVVACLATTTRRVVVAEHADVAVGRLALVRKRVRVERLHRGARDARHIRGHTHPEDTLLVGLKPVARCRSVLNVNPVDPVIAALEDEILRELIPVASAQLVARDQRRLGQVD